MIRYRKLGYVELNVTDSTSVKDARTERFKFLGYAFGSHCYRRNGTRYLGASPSEKSIKRVKQKIDEVLVPGNVACGFLRLRTAIPIDCGQSFQFIAESVPIHRGQHSNDRGQFSHRQL